MAEDKDGIRILLFSDTHLGFDYPIHPRIPKLRRGEDFFRNFLNVLDYAEQTRPHLIIHAGDVFFRSRISPVIRDRVYGMISDFLARSPIPFYVVPGNHERSNLPNSLFLHQRHLKIFHEAGIFEQRIHDIPVYICGFPFIRYNLHNQWQKHIALFREISGKKGLKLLVMHQAIEGATVGPGNFIFRKGKDVLGMDEIPDFFDAVFCGHIHRQQVLFKDRTGKSPLPVIFPGSTERTSFAEKEETKGFFELTFYHTKNIWTIEYYFHPLPSRPMVDLRMKPFEKNWQNTLIEQLQGIKKGSIIRFRFPEGNKYYPSFETDLARIMKEYRDQFIFHYRKRP